MKSCLLLLSILLFPLAGWAAEPPARLRLTVPDAVLAPGQQASLVIELLGANDQPAPAVKAVPVELAGLGALSKERQVVVPPGASRAEVRIQAANAGIWQIEARSQGLIPGFGTVACGEPRKQAAEIASPSLPRVRPTVRPTLRPSETIQPQRRPVRPVGPIIAREAPGGLPQGGEILRERIILPSDPSEPQTGDDPPVFEPSAVPAPPEDVPEALPEPAPVPSGGQGQILLLAQPTKLPRGRNGWEAGRVNAFWTEDGVPAQSPRDLEISLVFDSGAEAASLSRDSLRLPTGQFKSPDSVEISARSAGSAVLRALYPRGQSAPVRIDFLQPNPARLGFVNEAQTFRGMTAVSTEVLVRLFDDNGRPVVTDRPLPVEVVLQGPLGARSVAATMNSGAMQVNVPIELSRPGSYTVKASAPGLEDAQALNVRFAMDWALIAMSLLGGILGSLVRVTYRKEKVWPKGLVRVLVLGVAAALLVLLLSVFGLLSVFDKVLPAAGMMEKVPATNLFGALLLGFLAGLLFDKVLGRFLGGTRGRRTPRPSKKKPADSAPAPA